MNLAVGLGRSSRFAGGIRRATGSAAVRADGIELLTSARLESVPSLEVAQLLRYWPQRLEEGHDLGQHSANMAGLAVRMLVMVIGPDWHAGSAGLRRTAAAADW